MSDIVVARRAGRPVELGAPASGVAASNAAAAAMGTEGDADASVANAGRLNV